MIGLAAQATLLAPVIAGVSSHPGRLPLSVVVHATARIVTVTVGAAGALERAGIEG